MAMIRVGPYTQDRWRVAIEKDMPPKEAGKCPKAHRIPKGD